MYLVYCDRNNVGDKVITDVKNFPWDEFYGDEFTGDEYSGNEYSGDEFSSLIFWGRIFRRRIFRGRTLLVPLFLPFDLVLVL